MQTIVGLLALGIIVAVTFAALQSGGAPAQVVTLVIAGIVTYAVARVQEREKYQRELDAKLVTDKNVLYKAYLDMIKEYMGKGKRAPNPAQMLPRIQAFVFSSMLNASDDVIRAHNRWMKLTNNADASRQRLIVPALGDVILAMRRDTGEPKSTLRPVDIMRPLITDIDDNLTMFDEWERFKGTQATPQRKT
jgi:hypothetical protein